MIFRPAIWQPIAVGLGLLNLVAAGFAAVSGEPMHAAAHSGLALAFGAWARHLRQAPASGEREVRLEELEDEVSHLRRQLSEAEERLDFTERMVAQQTEARRMGPSPAPPQ